jgi:hypothetical protein
MVQTFLVEESKELIYDSEKIDEWKAKCEELGLSEQLALCQPEKSPIPFEYMNTVTQRVYQTLCPTVQEYRKYNKTAIPLEVLSLIALAEKESYFDQIEIWYDDKTPDPIAVGLLKGNSYNYKYYTIARWGDVLRPFKELKEKAIQVYTNSSRINLQRKLAEAKSLLENVEVNAQAYFDAQVENYNVVGF